MKTIKLLTLTVVMIISVGCSNKGNGDKFYVEYFDNNEIVHSTLNCKAIKGGVEICVAGQVYYDPICSKCMDEELLEIAKNGKKRAADKDDDDF